MENVTNLEQINQTVQDAREYAENIVDTVREPLIILDADLKVISANRTFYQTFKTKPENTEGHLIYNIGNQQWDIPKLRDLLEEILPKNTSFDNYEIEHDFPQLGKRIMILNARRICGETNKTEMILLAFEDITERKKAEKALEVTELRYRRLFESAQDGILILDFDTGNIMDVNPFLIDILGYSKEDFLLKHIWEIGVFKDAVPSKDNFLALQTKEYIRYEDLPLETKDGRRIEVEFVSNVYSVDGKKTIQCNIRNITERKKAEQELKVADEKLKESFQQIQSQKNELERTSRDLEETNRHLDGFANSVSHDLRAPLLSISGFSQVLLEEYKDKVNDQMKNYLERIFSGTQKMGDLMDALLHFSRTARADLQYETVDVEKIINNIIKDQTVAHPERTIDFVVQPLPKVEADGKMVEVIFVNLIGNAVKFTGKQKNAHIEIGGRQDNDEQQFYVKDNGAGFDMRFKDKLFVAFQRLHSGKEFEGNGIGLATVARLVTKHGGRVWAEGEIDKGATFYFALPLKKSNP
jgi:PAS domain S-box-containing protein